jgi:peptidoglycan/xylan/chitin deacetylase (PgdA/CDA1 family)
MMSTSLRASSVITSFTLGGSFTHVRDTAQIAQAVVICRRARRSSARVGVALVYHRVGGAGGDSTREILAAVSARAFAQQLEHLRRHYNVVRAAEFLDAVRDRKRGEPFPVAITFDDDMAGHLHNAVPALQRARVHATFFLGGYSLDGPHPFWWEDLQRAVDDRLVESLPHVAAPDLHAALAREPKAIFRVAATIESLERGRRDETAAALRAAVDGRIGDDGLRARDVEALVAAGFDVGFHTLRHDALTTLPDAELGDALVDGRQQLAAVVGKPLELISYPHGKADARVATEARTAGYRLGFTTNRRIVTADTDPLLAPRVPPAPSAGKTALRVARAVAGSVA